MVNIKKISDGLSGIEWDMEMPVVGVNGVNGLLFISTFYELQT